MLEIAPTSITVEMHVHHQNLSRSRRDTPSLGAERTGGWHRQ
jgi:hypothetical protein